jgi:hypothetical protein
MIRITNSENIKKSGDFKLDGLHVKKFSFEYPTTGKSKQVLTIELVPFANLDDGSRVYDLDTVYKVFIPDVDAYLMKHGFTNVINAYFATEMGIADILADKYPLLQAKFYPPQQG